MAYLIDPRRTWALAERELAEESDPRRDGNGLRLGLPGTVPKQEVSGEPVELVSVFYMGLCFAGEKIELGVWYLPVLWPSRQTNLKLFVRAEGHGALAVEHGGGQPHVALGWVAGRLRTGCGS